MKCGEEIRVKGWDGSYEMRLIAQCHGRFMVISGGCRQMNGYLLPSWPSALRELVALTVPAKLGYDKQRTVESSASDQYVGFPLTYPLSVQGLVDLFGVDVAAVQHLLKDYAVPTG